VIISRMRMGGALRTHGEMRNAYTKFWPGNLKGRDQLGDLAADGKII
jgi:hypothetical protein